MKLKIRMIAVAVIGLMTALSAFAQVTTSSMSGKIVDEAGVPVAGATVIATHTPSGSQYYSIADSEGMYRILNILPRRTLHCDRRDVRIQQDGNNRHKRSSCR